MYICLTKLKKNTQLAALNVNFVKNDVLKRHSLFTSNTTPLFSSRLEKCAHRTVFIVYN